MLFCECRKTVNANQQKNSKKEIYRVIIMKVSLLILCKMKVIDQNDLNEYFWMNVKWFG